MCSCHFPTLSSPYLASPAQCWITPSSFHSSVQSIQMELVERIVVTRCEQNQLPVCSNVTFPNISSSKNFCFKSCAKLQRYHADFWRKINMVAAVLSILVLSICCIRRIERRRLIPGYFPRTEISPCRTVFMMIKRRRSKLLEKEILENGSFNFWKLLSVHARLYETLVL